MLSTWDTSSLERFDLFYVELDLRSIADKVDSSLSWFAMAVQRPRNGDINCGKSPKKNTEAFEFVLRKSKVMNSACY